MLLDNVRLAKLKAVLEQEGIVIEDTAELEAIGIKIAQVVSLKEFLRMAPPEKDYYEL